MRRNIIPSDAYQIKRASEVPLLACVTTAREEINEDDRVEEKKKEERKRWNQQPRQLVSQTASQSASQQTKSIQPTTQGIGSSTRQPKT